MLIPCTISIDTTLTLPTYCYCISQSNVEIICIAVPVEGKTLQALFDKLRISHFELKDEFKQLCVRCAENSELTTLKALLLQYPPLHSLNDILDDISSSPNMKMIRTAISTECLQTQQHISFKDKGCCFCCRLCDEETEIFAPPFQDRTGNNG